MGSEARRGCTFGPCERCGEIAQGCSCCREAAALRKLIEGDGPTYDPSTHRVVPRDAVVLGVYHAREILAYLEEFVLEALQKDVRMYERFPALESAARADLEDAETMVARLRSALDGEG